MTATASAAGFQFTTEAVAGPMYHVGHNRNFGNHRATDPDFRTAPAAPRLRSGLAHAATGTDDRRDDVDFDACPIRSTDGNGDALTEADAAATVASGYGTADWDHDNHGGTPALKVPRKLFLHDLSSAPAFNAGHALANVRISDGGAINQPLHPAPRSPTGTAPWNPTTSPRPW